MGSEAHKKLSYRRETARQLRMSFRLPNRALKTIGNHLVVGDVKVTQHPKSIFFYFIIVFVDNLLVNHQKRNPLLNSNRHCR